MLENQAFEELTPTERFLRLELWRKIDYFRGTDTRSLFVPPTHIPAMFLGHIPADVIYTYVDTAEEGLNLMDLYPGVEALLGDPLDLIDSFPRALGFIVLEHADSLDIEEDLPRITTIASKGLATGGVVASLWPGSKEAEKTKEMLDEYEDWIRHGNHLFLKEKPVEEIYREVMLKSIAERSSARRQEAIKRLNEMLEEPEVRRRAFKEFEDTENERVKLYAKDPPTAAQIRVGLVRRELRKLARRKNIGFVHEGYIWSTERAEGPIDEYITMMRVERAFPGMSVRKFHDQMEFTRDEPFSECVQFGEEGALELANDYAGRKLKSGVAALAEYLGVPDVSVTTSGEAQ